MKRFGRFPGKKPYLFLLLAALTAATTAQAQQAVDVPAHSLIDDPEIKDWIYGGLNLGYTRVGTGDNRRESDKDGFHFTAKALYSKYFGQWVVDVGGGWSYHKVSGSDRISPLANPTVKVITRMGLIEVSPRYRLDPNWQIGPVFNVVVGDDVSFDETTAVENDAMNILLGPRIQYEFAAGSGRWRFGAQMLTDVAIANRQVWSFQADVQYGIPLSFGKWKESSVPETVPEPVAVGRPKEPEFAVVTRNQGVKIHLGEAVLRFRTASFELRPESRAILARLSKYLRKYDGAWTKMRVEGHTDIRGSLAYNDRLADQRARTVRRELVALGIPADRIATQGFGPRQPIDPARDLEAYALNRRVELWLEGVTNPEAITRDLNELR